MSALSLFHTCANMAEVAVLNIQATIEPRMPQARPAVSRGMQLRTYGPSRLGLYVCLARSATAVKLFVGTRVFSAKSRAVIPRAIITPIFFGGVILTVKVRLKAAAGIAVSTKAAGSCIPRVSAVNVASFDRILFRMLSIK